MVADFVVRLLRPADRAAPVMIYARDSGGEACAWPGVPMSADPDAPTCVPACDRYRA